MLFGSLIGATTAQSNQTVTDAAISKMINAYKSDPKGPYKDIRWFCKDGSTVAPQERCPEPGVQRARYKDEVVALGASHHIFRADPFYHGARGFLGLRIPGISDETIQSGTIPPGQ